MYDKKNYLLMKITTLWATIMVAFAITIGGLLAFMPPEEAEAKGPPIFKAKLMGSPAVGIPILTEHQHSEALPGGACRGGFYFGLDA